MDCDARGLREYARRLRDSHGAVTAPGADWWLRGGGDDAWCAVHLHTADARTFVAPGRGATAVLSFSVSQMVSGAADADAMFEHLLGTNGCASVVVVGHDHGVPPGDHDDQDVRVRVTAPPGCGCVDAAATLRCATHGTLATLETTIPGSSLALAIREWACDPELLRTAAARHPAAAGVRLERPFAERGGDVHWLLRSLFLLHVRTENQ